MSGRMKSPLEASRAAAAAVAIPAEALRLHSPSADSMVGRLLHLQRTHGNRSVGALLNGNTLRRKCASESTELQSAPVLRRKCDCGGACDDCAKEEQLRRSATGPAPVSSAPPIVNEVLRSPGRSLDPQTRSFFEARFGQDFSGVRIHTGGTASHSAVSVNASAYTVGHNIVFAANTYRPDSDSGRRLMAHELAHVVQQAHFASSSVQRQIPIGPVDDPAEHEADRMADAALAGAAAVHPHAEPDAVVRRAPLTPQKKDEKRTASVKLTGGDTVEVTRTFRNCPCSRVSDTRTGVFYNPDLDKLAIAYRHCKGSTTFDVYLKTATDFSQGSTQGTGQAGIDVNVWGKTVQGRVIVELVGENQGAGPGVGGHAKLVLQGGQWRVILEPKFLRAIGQQTPGTNPNQLEVNLGAKYGKYSVEIGGKDLLSPTRDFTGAGCYELSSSVRICASLDVQGTQGGGPNVTPNVVFKGEFGEGARKEKCYNCLCPAPVKQFTCVGHHHVPEKQPPPVPEARTPEFRYYFHYDTTANSEESYLRDESTKNMDEMAALIKRGYRITSITGFASPEGLEGKINDPLALARAKKTTEIVTGKVDSTVAVPDGAVGRSELLGRNPAAPSTHLAGGAGRFQSPLGGRRNALADGIGNLPVEDDQGIPRPVRKNRCR